MAVVSKALDRQGGTRAAARAALAGEPPPPQGLSHRICPQPPLCHAPSRGVFLGRGHSHLGVGVAGLKTLGAGGPLLEGPGLQLFSVLALVLRMEGWAEPSLSSRIAPSRTLFLGPGLQRLGSRWLCREDSGTQLVPTVSPPAPQGHGPCSHLSFGYFFDRFGPLGCLVSEVIF